MRYPPGDLGEQPRLIPSQALDSMAVLLILPLGLTAQAAQPKGIMCIILGRTPVIIS